MKRILAAAVAAGLLVSACGLTAKTVRTESGLLLTFYTMPRRPQPGWVQVGLRVQDRDYRILKLTRAVCRVEGPNLTEPATQPLRPAPGRDYRTHFRFPAAGDYRLVLAGETAGGEAFQETLEVKIRRGHRRGG